MEKNTKDFKISKKKLKRIIRIALLVLCILLVLKVISLISKDKNPNNLSNMGLAVEYKGKTYFNKWEVGIFWTKGTTEKQVTNETAYSMTLVGDRIYYIRNFTNHHLFIFIHSFNDYSEDERRKIFEKIRELYLNNKGYIYTDFLYYPYRRMILKLVLDDNYEEFSKIASMISSQFLENLKILSGY